MVLGSGNVFYVIDRPIDGTPAFSLPEGISDFRGDYRAVVSFYNYQFDQVDSLNVFVRTPAQQIVWAQDTVEWEREFVSKGESIRLPMEKTFNVVSPWFENWLNKNIGQKYKQWDVYTRGLNNNPCIFFKRRKDALAFIKQVEERLKGIQLSV
jgi:hypothetical protein